MVYGIMFISLLLYIPTDKGICNFHFLMANKMEVKSRIDDSF